MEFAQFKLASLWVGSAKAFLVTRAFDEPMTAKHMHGFIDALVEHGEIGDACVHFHPEFRLVTARQAARWRGAMGGEHGEQRVDRARGGFGLRRVDAVIDVNVPHLLGQGVRQRLEGERRAVGGL
jgi:hypothetical protein